MESSKKKKKLFFLVKTKLKEKLPEEENLETNKQRKQKIRVYYDAFLEECLGIHLTN